VLTQRREEARKSTSRLDRTAAAVQSRTDHIVAQMRALQASTDFRVASALVTFERPAHAAACLELYNSASATALGGCLQVRKRGHWERGAAKTDETILSWHTSSRFFSSSLFETVATALHQLGSSTRRGARDRGCPELGRSALALYILRVVPGEETAAQVTLSVMMCGTGVVGGRMQSSELRYRGTTALRVRRAPEPDDMAWENVHRTKLHTLPRRVASAAALAVLLLVTLVVVASFRTHVRLPRVCCVLHFVSCCRWTREWGFGRCRVLTTCLVRTLRLMSLADVAARDWMRIDGVGHDGGGGAAVRRVVAAALLCHQPGRARS